MTFSVDKSVSALWAIAEPAMRERIEAMATAAARAGPRRQRAQVLQLHPREREGREPAGGGGPDGRHLRPRHQPGERPAASRPTARSSTSRGPGKTAKWRAHHQYPVYSWKKAAGALFRAEPGLGAATGPGRADGAVRPRQRVHAHRRHAGRPQGVLVEAAQGHRRDGGRARDSVSRERLAHGRREQDHPRGQVARQRPRGEAQALVRGGRRLRHAGGVNRIRHRPRGVYPARSHPGAHRPAR